MPGIKVTSCFLNQIGKGGAFAHNKSTTNTEMAIILQQKPNHLQRIFLKNDEDKLVQ